jgi:hypothetical protein
MKINSLIGTVFLILVFSYTVRPDDIQTNGRVCAEPSAPCQSSKWQFRQYDLSFKLPRELKWLNNYRSATFYAIILKSMRAIPDPDGPAGERECSGYVSETERTRVQKMFATRKVFASRFGCGSPGVWYTNVNADYNFLAVYAGETQATADSFLRTVRGSFPGANLRKIQIVLDYGD